MDIDDASPAEATHAGQAASDRAALSCSTIAQHGAGDTDEFDLPIAPPVHTNTDDAPPATITNTEPASGDGLPDCPAHTARVALRRACGPEATNEELADKWRSNDLAGWNQMVNSVDRNARRRAARVLAELQHDDEHSAAALYTAFAARTRARRRGRPLDVDPDATLRRFAATGASTNPNSNADPNSNSDVAHVGRRRRVRARGQRR